MDIKRQSKVMDWIEWILRHEFQVAAFSMAVTVVVQAVMKVLP